MLSAARVMFLVLVFGAGGCLTPRGATDVQCQRGLVWMFPGVEGSTLSLARACRAFRAAGVESAIRVHDWNRPCGLLLNLMAYERNRRDAARIAAEIAGYRRQHPRAPIDLVGYSGGGGVAIMVAEALPEYVSLRNVVLAQPALSPDYDLSRALTHVEGKLVHFYCPYDWLMLGAGTRVFGTIDRKYVVSAGKVGFDLEKAVPDPHLRLRVEQIRWSRKMLAAGHLAGHPYILGYRWNKAFVAPYLLPPAASD